MARSEGPLAELPAMQQAGGDLSWSAQDGAWQIVQLHGGGRPADSIVRETQAPVLVAQVFDGDVAAVDAASPKGLRWECVLSPRTAQDSYGAPERLLTRNQEAAPSQRTGRESVAINRLLMPWLRCSPPRRTPSRKTWCESC